MQPLGIISWIFFFSLPWTGALVGLGIPSPARGLGLLALLATLFVVGNRGLRLSKVVDGPVVSFLALYLISFFWAWSADAWVDRMPSLLSVATAHLILTQNVGRTISIGQIQGALIAGAVVLASIVLGARVAGVHYGFSRVSAGTMDPNEVAFLLCLGIGLLFESSITTSRFIKAILQCIIALAVLQTGSRSGLLAMGVMMLLALLKEGFSLRRVALSGSLVVALVAVLYGAWSHLPEEVTNRTEGTFSELRGERDTDRFDVWRRSLETADKALPLGVGGGGVAEALLANTGRYVEAHNVPMSLIVQFGIFGCTILLAIGIILRRPLLDRDPVSWAVIGAVAIFSSMLSLEYRPVLWVIVVFLLLRSMDSRAGAKFENSGSG